jgi:hypothetical protein
MQSTNRTLIDGYLTAVREATRSLPPGRQASIVDDLESHIEQALPPDAAESEVRTVLERLGSPELIAAEAGAEAVVGGPSRIKEVIGLIMISVGSLIPIVGWVVGIVLVWMSPVWSKAQKLMATLVWPFGWFTMLLFGLTSIRSSSSFDEAASNGALQALGVILLVAAPVVVLAWLIRSLIRADTK